MSKYGCHPSYSTPYHPQNEWSVKVTIEVSKNLERTVEKTCSWSDKLDDALWAFRTAYKTPMDYSNNQLPPFEALLWRGYTTIGYPGPPDFPRGHTEFRDRFELRLRTLLTNSMKPLVSGVVSRTDKSKITRKQSKASKHGHENQKSSKRSQKSKALANFHLQGPFLHFSKVIYNLRERKERQGLKVLTSQRSTVLTVEE
ncbi:reverse transcriptase domain-containing protein [Tanacetum coccineum]|uniref:Reverse transcriptase domain-containing protein n=1 Tax=Tanacetum coccineum TaxID=301880 RepID=A0ABQ5ESY8_9ASTR